QKQGQTTFFVNAALRSFVDHACHAAPASCCPMFPCMLSSAETIVSKCFFADPDRSYYLFQLGRLLRPSGCVLHAYCLKTNHVHLLLTFLHEGACARLMKHLGQLHTQYVNKLYGRIGTLWEGRFDRTACSRTAYEAVRSNRHAVGRPLPLLLGSDRR